MDEDRGVPIGSAGPRRALLVLGMHRSGTSALAGTLQALGATAPATSMPRSGDNPRGYWESAVVARVNDAILAAGGSSWGDWRSFDAQMALAARDHRTRMARAIASEFGAAPLFVLKDPRLSRLLPAWLPVLAGEGIAGSAIIALRSPAAVAASLAKRDGMAPETAVLLWLRHLLDAERDSRELPRVVVSYDALLSDWAQTMARVGAGLGLRWPLGVAGARSRVESFLDPALRHDPSRVPKLSSAYAEVWVHHAWTALQEMEQSGDSPSVRATLDRVRAQFDDACRLFGPAVHAHAPPNATAFQAAAAAHARPQLPEVTICAVDTVCVGLSARAIEESARRIDAADAILFTDAEIAGGFRTRTIAPLTSRDAYSRFVLKDLVDHLATSHALIVQWDGYVVEPAAWDDEFLAFDYVGACWGRYDDGMDVGNGGFSLRSARLLRALQDARFLPRAGQPEDELICRTWRPLLEREFGIRFAPPDVAARFSQERVWHERPSFGFHGLFNFWRHLDDAAIGAVADLLPAERVGSREFAELVVLCFLHERTQALRLLAARWAMVQAPPQIAQRLGTILEDADAAAACLRHAGLAR